MWRKQAERFEVSLQQVAQGERPEEPYGLLVDTAHAVASIEVPPPPRGLVAGRRKLTAEAAQLRSRQRGTNWGMPLLVSPRMRLVPVLVSLVILLAVVPAFAQEVAASLPGSPLYELKVLAQEVHLWMTSSPTAHTDLDLSVAERRLNDVAAALEQGQSIDETTADSTEKQLARAVETFAENPDSAKPATPLQLMEAIQNCEQVMVRALNRMSESDQRPLRELLRQMERARRELHPGVGEAAGELERARQGDPPGPEEMPGSVYRPDPQWKSPGPQNQGAADPGSGEAAQPTPAANKQQGSAGSGQPTETPPAAAPTPTPTPTPEDPQQQNGEQQQGPGGNEPGGNSAPGNQGNGGQSGHP